MSAEERRLAALTAWARWAESNGWDVPSSAVLAEVAAAGSADWVRAPLAVAWGPTIAQLLHQVRFGVNDPHLQLPDELRRPTEPDPEAEQSGTRQEQEQERTDPRQSGARSPSDSRPPEGDGLLAHLRADPAVPAPDLKDVHLKLIVKSGLRTADQIRSFLPVGPDRRAEAIAASIAAFLQGGPPSSDAPPPSAPQRSAREEPVPPPAARVPDGPRVRQPAPAAAATGEDGSVSADGFAPYEYGGGGEPRELLLSRDEQGVIVAAWPAHEAKAVFRLVAEDDGAPYSPDDSRLAAATTALRATDAEPLERAVRHYQVWRNDGGSVAEAKRSQPVLHAEGVFIAPVERPTLRYEAGRVVGEWRTRPGAVAVHVYRVPRRLAAQSSGRSEYRLDPQARNLNGFVDAGVQAGERYVYQLVVEAEVDGASRLSRVHPQPMDVPMELAAVTDLTVTRTPSGAVDLHWSAPAGGRVVVYRTREEPAAGIGREPVSERVLAEQGGLRVEDRIAHPVDAGSDRSESMTGVAWPAGWTRAFFTPVVVHDGQAMVGPPARFADVPPVGRPVLEERVQRQLLMFDWPEGADSVEAYRSETGAPSADALHGRPEEISRDDYRERGGFELRGLPARGCDLHLVSVLFDRSRRVQSEAVRVHYDGILRLQYTCAVKRPIFGQKGVFVGIGAEFPPGNPPPFVLVHHPDRLPLSTLDGTRLAMVRDDPDAGAPTVQFRPKSLGRPGDEDQLWRTDDASWRRIAGAGGFVRLFVDVPPELTRRLALLDPPVKDLRVGGKGAAGA